VRLSQHLVSAHCSRIDQRTALLRGIAIQQFFFSQYKSGFGFR